MAAFGKNSLSRTLAVGAFGIAVSTCMTEPALAQRDQSENSAPKLTNTESELGVGPGITSYPSEFFMAANASNARDMLARLPSFTFIGGSSSTRGFSGSAGNVLVDGAAPSSKSVTLDEVLQRIPVSNVARIDVIRGGTAGIDMQGYPVVANVIRKSVEKNSGEAASETSGLIEVTPSVNKLGQYQTTGRAAIAHRTEHLSFDVSIDAESNAQGPGAGRSGNMGGAVPGGGGGGSRGVSASGNNGFQAKFDKLGSLINSGNYLTDAYEYKYSSDGVAEYRHDWLGTFRLNASAGTQKERINTYYFATDAQKVQTIQASPSLSINKDYELGANYEGGYGGYAVTALGLYRRAFPISTSNNITTSTESGSNAPNGETLARATLRKEFFPWLTLQAGAEGALNFRDTNSFLIIGGISQLLPNSNVRVEESRAEFSGTANISLWPELRTELGVRYETSVISQIGDTNQERAFAFVKPRVIATYDLTTNTQLRFRAERRIGQLDFGSFSASNDATIGTVTAGNANLEPERSWEYEGAIEYNFWKKGAASLTYLHSNIQKINDRIVVITPTKTYDAPGNIGDGTRDRITINAVLPFDELGLDNLRFTANLSWTWSELTDPVTGKLRGTSSEFPFYSNFMLSQDIPTWNSSFGFSGGINPRRTTYLLKELRYEKGQPRTMIYWNWRAKPDLLLNISLENIIKRQRVRERILFTTSRAQMDLYGTETLRTVLPPVFRVQLRKTF